jgi:hypothetical protein
MTGGQPVSKTVEILRGMTKLQLCRSYCRCLGYPSNLSPDSFLASLLFAMIEPTVRLMYLGSSNECVNEPKLPHLAVCSCISTARKSNDDPFTLCQSSFGVELAALFFFVSRLHLKRPRCRSPLNIDGDWRISSATSASLRTRY